MSRPHPIHEPAAESRVRLRADLVDVFSAMNEMVLKAIEDQMERRKILPGSLAAIQVHAEESPGGTPGLVRITFEVHIKGPDDYAVEFKGAS